MKSNVFNLKPLLSFVPHLTLLLLLGATVFFVNPVRPDFYQPARPSLMGAKHHLALFYADEKRLLKELAETQFQLNITLDLLTKAQNQLSERQQLILSQLREELHRLDDSRNSGEMTPDRLHKTYSELAAKLGTLIDGLSRSG
jgi:hypothetical protein